MSDKNTADETPATDAAPEEVTAEATPETPSPFTAISADDIPGSAPKGYDATIAQTMLAIASTGSLAKSSATFADAKAARKAANAAKRVLAYVAPSGKVATSKVFGIAGGFTFAVGLADAEASA